jgi:hypothetical protein
VIVENAFLKLPELLVLRDYDRFRETSEATVTHLFASAVLMELDSRNVSRPFDLVHIEKPYPVPADISAKADLFVDLARAVPKAYDGPLAHYGTRAHNWIEVKAFLSSVRGGSKPPTTKNVGKILRDLLRLCLLPGQSLCSRYMLIVFSGQRSESLAMSRRDGKRRKWLDDLLTEGYIDTLRIDLSEEPPHLRAAVGLGFKEATDLQVGLKLRTMVFEPKGVGASRRDRTQPLFWGYLARIRWFDITVSGLSVRFGDEPGRVEQSDPEQFRAVQGQILSRMKG